MEFALIAPLLFLVVFGIIEFGWAFFQNMDVRHGSREAARLAAVNYKTTATPSSTEQRDQILSESCDRMDDSGDITIILDKTGTSAVGQRFTVRVEKPLDTLTGFLDFALGGIDLESEVESRIEQTATWADTPSGGTPCSAV